jgi:hypothetical protein
MHYISKDVTILMIIFIRNKANLLFKQHHQVRNLFPFTFIVVKMKWEVHLSSIHVEKDHLQQNFQIMQLEKCKI